MRFNAIFKTLILVGAAGIVSLSAFSPLIAQSPPPPDGGGGGGGGSCNQCSILGSILDKVNDLPKALVSLGAFTSAWMDPDGSDATAKMQENFSKLGDFLSTDASDSIATQNTLNKWMLSNNGNNVYAFNAGMLPSAGEGYKPLTPKSIPYANDLSFTTLLGAPIINDPRKDVDSMTNYIMNASGSNMYHVTPGNSWQGKEESQRRYQNFYNTVMAATSFNNYILTFYATDKGKYNNLQNALIKQASDPKDWFAKVSSENIGFVLRQLLMYQSQIFVLLTELVETQKQMVSAQAMNTAVLVAMNQINENAMTAYAKGENPSF